MGPMATVRRFWRWLISAPKPVMVDAVLLWADGRIHKVATVSPLQREVYCPDFSGLPGCENAVCGPYLSPPHDPLGLTRTFRLDALNESGGRRDA